jgi:LmbE family N-acetylglucosaminyl deacetylase
MVDAMISKKKMIPKNKKILFFCAHPDDDVISSGGLIYKLVKNKNDVLCVYLTSSPLGVLGKKSLIEKRKIRSKEALVACMLLGCRTMFLDLDKPRLEVDDSTIDRIRKLMQDEAPSMIFLPPANDAHPTHRKVHEIITRTGKQAERWIYETWTPLPKPNFIFFFDDALMKIKKKAISCHKSQLIRSDYLEAAVCLNRFRGIMGLELLGDKGKVYKKQRYGEAFLIVK